MSFTITQHKILQLLSANEWALSYREIHEELEDIDGKAIYNALEDLVSRQLVAYGPSSFEHGVEVRTWIVTDPGLAVFKKEIPVIPQPKHSKKEKSVAKPAPIETTNVSILTMFDDAVKVMRTSIEASIAQPVFPGDIGEAIEAIKKYSKVATAMDDHAGRGHLSDVLAHLKELNSAQASG